MVAVYHILIQSLPILAKSLVGGLKRVDCVVSEQYERWVERPFNKDNEIKIMADGREHSQVELYFEKLLHYTDYADEDRVARSLINRLCNGFDNTLLYRWEENVTDKDVIIHRMGCVYLADFSQEMDWVHIADFIISVGKLISWHPFLEKQITHSAKFYLKTHALEWILLNGGWDTFPQFKQKSRYWQFIKSKCLRGIPAVLHVIGGGLAIVWAIKHI